MAEFKEVMRIRKRICDSMDQYCTNCPLKNFSDCETPFIDEWGKYKDAIVQWASEHPEPQYPTWEEWQRENFPDAPRNLCIGDFIGCIDKPSCKTCRQQPIPADIAERLGIKPKGAKE